MTTSIYSSEKALNLLANLSSFNKRAFQPAPPPQGAMPPGVDPSMMPPGAMPPGMDPSMMPPGAMPPGAMPPGAMPPGVDPSMMPPGAMPPQPAGVNPEIETMLSEVLGGMEQMALVLEQEKAEKAEMAQRLESMSSRMNQLESFFKQSDSAPAGV